MTRFVADGGTVFARTTNHNGPEDTLGRFVHCVVSDDVEDRDGEAKRIADILNREEARR